MLPNADCDLGQEIAAKQIHDIVGTYQRSDIFQLVVDTGGTRRCGPVPVRAVTGEARAAGAVMDPAVTTKRAPPPDRLGSRITPTPDAYVIGHFGIAQVTAPDWSLRVDGLVGDVLRISLPQLRAVLGDGDRGIGVLR